MTPSRERRRAPVHRRVRPRSGPPRTRPRQVAALESPLRLSVDPLSVESARAVLDRYGASYTLRASGNKATFLIANPNGLSGDDHPYAAALGADLLAADVAVIAYRVP